MISRHIHESDFGVSIAVDYTRDGDGGITFESARALDDSYAPTGPDLCDMLHTLRLVEPDESGDMVAETYLSVILEEIQNDSNGVGGHGGPVLGNQTEAPSR